MPALKLKRASRPFSNFFLHLRKLFSFLFPLRQKFFSSRRNLFFFHSKNFSSFRKNPTNLFQIFFRRRPSPVNKPHSPISRPLGFCNQNRKQIRRIISMRAPAGF